MYGHIFIGYMFICWLYMHVYLFLQKKVFASSILFLQGIMWRMFDLVVIAPIHRVTVLFVHI